jgi:hypothetical protein
MSRTQHDQVVRIVSSAFGPETNVMNVHVASVPAPGDDAAVSVAAKHFAPSTTSKLAVRSHVRVAVHRDFRQTFVVGAPAPGGNSRWLLRSPRGAADAAGALLAASRWVGPRVGDRRPAARADERSAPPQLSTTPSPFRDSSSASVRTRQRARNWLLRLRRAPHARQLAENYQSQTQKSPRSTATGRASKSHRSTIASKEDCVP